MKVDHLVYAAPDLDAAIDQIEALLGVRATPGGQHRTEGTRNALIALGPETYLEIVGPDPQQPKPPAPRWFRIDELAAPALVTWAAKSNQLDRMTGRALALGLDLGEVIAGSRERGDGLLLSWRYTDPRALTADGVLPFFIEWGATPHPALSAAPGASLIRLRAEHPDAGRIGAIAQRLGLDLPVQAGPTPALFATLTGPRGEVELR